MVCRSTLLLLVAAAVSAGLMAAEVVDDPSTEDGPERVFEEQVLVTGGAEQVESLPGSADFVDLTMLEKQSYDDVNRACVMCPASTSRKRRAMACDRISECGEPGSSVVPRSP